MADRAWLDSVRRLEVYGFSQSGDEDSPIDLREVSFIGTPEMLRALSSFFERTAAEIEVNETAFDHAHLQVPQEPQNAVDVVICRKYK